MRFEVSWNVKEFNLKKAKNTRIAQRYSVGPARESHARAGTSRYETVTAIRVQSCRRLRRRAPGISPSAGPRARNRDLTSRDAAANGRAAADGDRDSA